MVVGEIRKMALRMVGGSIVLRLYDRRRVECGFFCSERLVRARETERRGKDLLLLK